MGVDTDRTWVCGLWGRCGWLILGLLLSLSGPRRVSGQVQPPDSADLHSAARHAQSRFERLRVRRLPREGMGSGACDEVIGRICMRHDPEDDFEPSPEEPEIQEGRDAFLVELGDIGARIPGDSWVLGQRVWYTIEAGRTAEALAIADDCAAEPWWCSALRGLALHAGERFEESEEAYVRTLQQMPANEHAEWAEALEPVLGRDRLGWVKDQPDREEALSRFWQLADPSWLVPGNDRRTAHYARLTASRIRARARNPYGLSWGFDLAELLVRYGWEIAWGRDFWRAGGMGEERVVGHHPPKSREYAPPAAVLEAPAAVGPDDWELDRKRPQTAYAPSYAPDFGPMFSQSAAFRRPEGVLIVAAPDSVELPGQRGLFLLNLADGSIQGGSDTASVFTRLVPWGEWMLSTEWVDPGTGRGRRSRQGVRFDPAPPDVPTLSGLLLVGGGGLPSTLAEAVEAAHPGRIVHSGERLALAWELYRQGGPALDVDYRVLLEPLGRGLLRRAGEWTGLLDPDRPVVLAWSEVDHPSLDPHFRSVGLSLPELEPGAYRLSLEVRLPGRSPLFAAQEVRVAPDGPAPAGRGAGRGWKPKS